MWNGRYSEETLPYINSGSVNLIVAFIWTAFMATTLVLVMGWSRKVRAPWLQRLAVRVSFQTQKTVKSCQMRQTIVDVTTTPQSYPNGTANFDKNEATRLAEIKTIVVRLTSSSISHVRRVNATVTHTSNTTPTTAFTVFMFLLLRLSQSCPCN